MIKSNEIKFVFIALGTVTTILYQFFFQDVSLTLMLAVLGIGVSIFGLPHGAIDGYLAQRTGLAKNLKSVCAFVAVYLLISGVVICAWFIIPDAMFFLFLVITAWHFGEDGGAQNSIERLLFGLCVIALPPLFHSGLTTELFEFLAITKAGEFVTYMQALAPIVVFVSMAIFLWNKINGTQSGTSIIVVLGLLAFAYALPPLLFFTVYFCALHSPKHFQSVAGSVPQKDRWNFKVLTIFYTLATIVLAGISFWILIPFVVFDQAFVLVIFVGLAALTVPHMILVDGIWAYKTVPENDAYKARRLVS